MNTLSSNIENLNNISVYSKKFNYIPDVEYISPHGIKMGLLSNINETLSTHYIVYKIYNIINGKYYIGQHKTKNPFDYYMGSGDAIIMAEKKYGLSAFIKVILFDFDNFNDMNNKEQELVCLSNCWPYDQMSYNIRCGGNSQVNPLTIEKSLSTKAEHGISYKGENNPMYGISPQERMTPEVFNGWLKNLRNYHPDDNVKNKISKTLRGRKFTDEHKKKISSTLRGKPKNLSDDQRKEIAIRASMTFKGIPKTDEHKQKIGLGNKGKVRSEECKQHMRKIMTGRKVSDEARRKMSIARKGKKFSKEHNEKISKNNGMHGHSVTDFMTADEIKIWKQHIAEKSRGRKKMYNPITDHLVSVKKDEFQKYLDLGYYFGSRPCKKPKKI